MNLFRRKAKVAKLTYDHENLKPVIRSSICTGEATAGFLNKKTQQFQEVMLITSSADLHEFMEKYGIEEKPETIY